MRQTIRRWLRSSLGTYGIDLRKVRRSFAGRSTYRRNAAKFERMLSAGGHAAEFPLANPWPCLADRYETGGTAKGQYFHQDLLVAQWIFAEGPERHIDVGSRVDGFVAHVASFRSIDVLDIRPVKSSASGITFHERDIMVADSRWDESCDSLSCLHTIEHFGLGRYNDTLDPDGWRLGWANLVRMARPGGTIYLSTMIGPQRIEFDAHRVFAVPTLVRLVAQSCDIEATAFIDDSGDLHLDADPLAESAADSFGCTSGCVIFRLRKRDAT